jgi:hypothetical protein
VLFEGYVDEHEEFERHPVCDGAEGGDEAKCCGTVLNQRVPVR